MDAIDITPGSVAQVARTLGGLTVLVTEDVQNVATDLAALGDFHLHYDPVEELYVVMQVHDGTEKLVTSARECDQRIVARVRQITAPGYDLAGELERAEREADMENVHELSELMGDRAERLGHALRKDLGRHEAVSTLKSRVVVPKDVA